jgi:hypothetical protein
MAVLTELVTQGEILSYLGLGSSATDAQKGRILFIKRGVERLVRNYFGNNILSATYTHFLPKGNGFSTNNNMRCSHTSMLALPNYPITSITNLYEDTYAYFGSAANSFSSNTELTDGTDFYQELESSAWNRWGRLYRIGSYWPAVPGSIKVTYVAGWTRAQLKGEVTDQDKDASDLHQAICQAIAENWNESQSLSGKGGANLGPVKSERFVDWSVEYDTEHTSFNVRLSEDARSKMKPYKRPAIAQ